MTLTLVGAKPLSLRVLKLLLQSSDIQLRSVLTTPEEKHLQANAIQAGLEVATSSEELNSFGEFGLIVGYPKILKEDFISKFKRIFNIHFGILPYYRGSNTLSYAILNGEKEFGVSFHEVDRGVDTGPIYDIQKFGMPEDLTAAEILPIAENYAFECVRKNLVPAMRAEIMSTPQVLRFPLYTRAALDKMLPLDSGDPRELKLRKIRALTLPHRRPPYFLSEDGREMPVTKGDFL